MSELQAHYSLGLLRTRIADAIKAAGLDTTKPIDPAALAPLDQFHSQGFIATEELARLCSVDDTMRVLDVGAGLGGPARYLASRFQCRVACLEPVDDFRDVIVMLNELAESADRVSVHAGSACEMPFEDRSFDIVWMQNVSMNIKDKEGLYSEIHRVLRPGARFVFHEVFAGPKQPIRLPVPWASHENMNFLLTPDELRRLLEDVGFESQLFEINPQLPASPPPEPSPLNFAVFLPDFRERAQTSARNYSEDRTVTVRALVTKPQS